MCSSDPAGREGSHLFGRLWNRKPRILGKHRGLRGKRLFHIKQLRRMGGRSAERHLDGLMFAKSSIGFADVTDGTSNTAMLSELILTPDMWLTRTCAGYYNPLSGNVLLSTIWPPNAFGARPIQMVRQRRRPDSAGALPVECTKQFLSRQKLPPRWSQSRTGRRLGALGVGVRRHDHIQGPRQS